MCQAICVHSTRTYRIGAPVAEMCVEVAAETIYIVLCKWGLSVRCMNMIPKVSHVEIHNIVVQIPVYENGVVTCTI